MTTLVALVAAGLVAAAEFPTGRGTGVDSTIVIDDFERIDRWTAAPADGVRESLHSDVGRTGRALRMDYRFTGGGYAIARRTVDLPLPPNYALSFWLKGNGRPNTLEFKLVDGSGENVWWYTERDRRFGPWERILIRKRQISFAWGPKGGGDLDRVAAIEIVVTAGEGGGSGSIWVDDLVLTPLPVPTEVTVAPTATGAGAVEGPAAAAVDGKLETSWRPEAGRTGRLTVDLGGQRAFGAVTVIWDPDLPARDYTILASDDGTAWRPLARQRGGNGGRDHFFTPETEARYLRLDAPARVGLAEIRVEPLEAGRSRNAFFEVVAKASPRGSYPRYFSGERINWSVVGLDADAEQGLLDEDGMVDPGAARFAVEPFLIDSGRVLDWAAGERSVSLARGYLPIPTAVRRQGDLELAVTMFPIGRPTRSSLIVRYRITNHGAAAKRPRLVLAVRPLQVNPPWQFLGVPGGAARIDSLRWTGTALVVNGRRSVVALARPSLVSASTFAAGEIGERIHAGDLTAATRAVDPFGAASAGLIYPVELAAGATAEVAVELPLGRAGAAPGPRRPARLEAQAADEWAARLEETTIDLPGPGADLARTIRSNQAWVMVNRAGPAIQPGTRSYARSWIRDGALTSTAMLRFGHPAMVREFIEWYAPFQYPDGKVPCCVDRRGADPVPEHDSHGELIYLVMEYWRHTGDTALLRRMWPRVRAAAGYQDSLRQTRRTAEYRQADRNEFFGLLPPSISHEGYSAKPMHSYWDDFFALRGFRDAAAMAAVLGLRDEAARLAAIRDEFQRDVVASLARTMEKHRIDHLPGAADLGDFDATSTTIAVTPVEATEALPRAALLATFERYWRNVSRRRDSTGWENYTPYELRTVGTILRLGHKDRALALLADFMRDRDPPAWNQWSEVVWRDRSAPKFIGDTPHGWVGSDFLRSAADLFGYERETPPAPGTAPAAIEGSLVVGAGIDPSWLDGEGVRVRRLGTWWGPLSYTARRIDAVDRYGLEPGLRVPAGGILVVAPREGVRRVTIDGVAGPVSDTATVRKLPAIIEFGY